jgi:predicted DNA-binding protein (UPF0251 family)/predicted Fe-Mo cluster-binding NifX family protein
MPRPKRCRAICCYPDHWSFAPEDEAGSGIVTLTLDELETIRLIDLEGLNQAQCAEQMEVARTTVTAIYEAARKKIANSIINGKRMIISGGEYRLKEESGLFSLDLPRKGQNQMRIAATYKDGQIFQHFGHTAQFKIYDVADGEIKNSKIVDTMGQGHGALAGFLLGGDVDVLICGGIGGGAQRALAEAGIKLCAGVTGSADEAAEAYAAGKLNYSNEANCTHHEGHDGHGCGHHQEGHGGHGCGRHHAEHGEHGCGHHQEGHGGHGCGRRHAEHEEQGCGHHHEGGGCGRRHETR